MVEDIAFRGPLAVSSDMARRKAKEVAAAASLGYISSLDAEGFASRSWHVTAKGLNFLEYL